MPNKFTLEALKLLLSAKNGWRVVVLAVLGLIAYRMPAFVELVNAKKQAEKLEEDHQEFLDSANIHVKSFRYSQTIQDQRIEQVENDIDYVEQQIKKIQQALNTDIEEVAQRDLEKGEILLEELDPVDSLGASLYMTNPGNLYYNHNGHFISVIKDRHKKAFYYLQGNKRVYLP